MIRTRTGWRLTDADVAGDLDEARKRVAYYRGVGDEESAANIEQQSVKRLERMLAVAQKARTLPYPPVSAASKALPTRACTPAELRAFVLSERMVWDKTVPVAIPRQLRAVGAMIARTPRQQRRAAASAASGDSSGGDPAPGDSDSDSLRGAA